MGYNIRYYYIFKIYFVPSGIQDEIHCFPPEIQVVQVSHLGQKIKMLSYTWDTRWDIKFHPGHRKRQSTTDETELLLKFWSKWASEIRELGWLSCGCFLLLCIWAGNFFVNLYLGKKMRHSNGVHLWSWLGYFIITNVYVIFFLYTAKLH